MKHLISIIATCVILSVGVCAQGWRALTLPDIDSSRKLIQFIDSTHGWVFSDTAIIATTDAGVTWQMPAISYPAKGGLMDGKILNDSVGIIVLRNDDGYGYCAPAIYQTNLRDRTWKLIYNFKNKYGPPTINDYEGTNILNRRVVFLGRVLTPADKYFWWVNVPDGDIDSVSLPWGYSYPVGNWAYSDIGFRSSKTGYCTAYQPLSDGRLPWGFVLKTIDGGRTWNDDTVMYASGFFRTEFTDSIHGYMYCETNYQYDFVRSRFSSSSTLRYTIDSGITWWYVPHVPVKRGIFINDSIFIALSEDSTVYRSKLLGSFVNSQVIFNHVPVVDVFLQCDQKIWLLANDGKTIYTWDPLLHASSMRIPLPEKPLLLQNYPNPTSSITTFSIFLPNQSHVRIDLFDMLGKQVRNLANASYEKGQHTLSYDFGGIVAGSYIFQMKVTDQNRCFSTLTKVMSIIY
jgi:hypothetical protein